MGHNIRMIFGGDFFPGWLPAIGIMGKVRTVLGPGVLSCNDRAQLIRKRLSRFERLLLPYFIMDAKAEALFPLSRLDSLFSSYDIRCLNLEAPLTYREMAIDGKQFNLKCAQYFIESLLTAGIDIVSLANNHILDYGTAGLVDTMSLLRRFSIQHSGIQHDTNIASQRPEIVERMGTRIGFLSYVDPHLIDSSSESYFSLSPAPFPLIAEQVTKDIAEVRRNADTIVLLLHWGTEWSHIEDAQQVQMAHSFVDAGASLIIGHHPHVVQNVEEYRSGLIAYSLGNLFMCLPGVSGLRARKSIALEVILSGSTIKSYEIHPLWHSDKGQPVPKDCIDTMDLCVSGYDSFRSPGNLGLSSRQRDLHTLISVVMRDASTSCEAKWTTETKIDRIPLQGGWVADDGLVAMGREFCGKRLIDSLVCSSGRFNEIEITYGGFMLAPNSTTLCGFPDWFFKSRRRRDVILSISLGTEIIESRSVPWDEGFNIHCTLGEVRRYHSQSLTMKICCGEPGFVVLLRQEMPG